MAETTDIRQWLDGLKLGQYADVFAQNDIDLDIVGQLNETDLEKLGVSLGHRKRLLAAAAVLTIEPRAQTTGAAPIPAAAAERRQLTALFCDLAGSTEMSAKLDPEELRDIITSYQRTCTDVINDLQGYVAKYMGDGILAYFGYPHAHEDDADRAVLAGLGIVEAMTRAGRARATAWPLAVRIGIATGEVVVGDQIGIESSRESAVVGETPNLAARLQQSAPPNGVMVADRTRRLMRYDFVWSEPETLSLKGFNEPVTAWRALRMAGTARDAESAGAALPSLVGRQSELALLRERLDAARAGEGQAVLLVGEAGMGKSRITAAMMDFARVEGTPFLRFACSPFAQTSELKPFAAWIEREADIVRGEPAEANLQRLDTWLARARIDPGADAGVFAALLSLPMSGRYQMSDVTSKALREKTLNLIEAAIVGIGRRQPAMLVFEDVHWIDPTSAELLSRLIDHIGNLPVLVLVNARPEFEAPWARLPQVTALTVSRLPNRDATRLIEQTAGAHKLPADVVDHLLARAQGNPLFLQELTNALVNSLAQAGAQAGDRLDQFIHAIPATLRDLLTARLDQLGPAKLFAQAAAVIGPEFDKRLLAAVVREPEAAISGTLDRLAEAQIVVQQGSARDLYAFRHALIQEAAYQSLLKSTRRDYHQRIAEALETGTMRALGATEPERIAYHYAEAGIYDRAIVQWQTAGTRAAQRSANPEAVRHLSQALDLLRQHGLGSKADVTELALLTELGPALMATRGWNAPEVRTVYDQAMRLAGETGRSAEIFPALWGRWLTAHAGGEAQSARDLLRELFRLIDGRDTVLTMQAHHAACSTHCTDGDLAKSLEHMNAALAMYKVDQHRDQAMRYGGHDPCVCMECIGALAETVRGFSARAAQLSGDAFSLAQQVGHVPSIAHAQWYQAERCQILGQPEPALALSDRVLRIAIEKGLGQYTAQAKMIRGWSMTVTGDADAGLRELETGLAELKATGIKYHLQQRMGMRAQTYALARHPKAIETAEEAVAAGAETGERWFEAEALRINASALADADAKRAEAMLEQAVATASEQGTRLWEARARIDLAHSMAREQREGAARDVLAPIAGWDEAIAIPERAQALALIARLNR